MELKTRLFLGIFLVGLVADQLTKLWIVENVHYGEILVWIPGFLDITHVRNPGGAFSFLANAPVVGRMTFFIGATIAAIVLLVMFFRRLEPEDRLAAFALGGILAGAVGNLIDRIAYGEVIDFIDVHLWSGYSWPTFNLADSLIVVGVGLLFFDLFGHDEDETMETTDSLPPR